MIHILSGFKVIHKIPHFESITTIHGANVYRMYIIHVFIKGTPILIIDMLLSQKH